MEHVRLLVELLVHRVSPAGPFARSRYKYRKRGEGGQRIFAARPQPATMRIATDRSGGKMAFPGLMMETPLTLRMVYERARRLFADVEVVTKTAGGTARTTYGEVCHRAARLASALEAMGIRAGDRVATFAWNSSRHLELYLAVPSMGA